ncbi:RNA polymerase sigma factor SigZ, partial [Chitinophaga sp.]|uniref:RNA polymerase sigma factor SigZ n=1 Tax=Chitinophaga sp. TaxID=1869181 RepID=UPI002F934F22
MLQQPTIIWEQFNAELKKFICQKVKHDDHCYDILQEVFLKIYININKIQKAEHIRAYLFRIANNAVIDYYRLTRKNCFLTAYSCLGQEPEVTSLKEEYRLSDCLRPMIDTLPDIYRQALVLTDLDGITQKQYATIAGISLSGAKSRVQRAREKLKELIQKCCEYEFDKY